MTLPDGLYDQLITEKLAAKFDPNDSETVAVPDNGSDLLVDALARQLTNILEDVAGDEADKPRRQLELVNALLLSLRQRLSVDQVPSESAEIIDLISHPARMLKAIQRNRKFPLKLVWLLHGCSQRVKVRRRCFRKSGANSPPRTKSIFWLALSRCPVSANFKTCFSKLPRSQLLGKQQLAFVF